MQEYKLFNISGEANGSFTGIASTDTEDYGADVVKADAFNAKLPLPMWWNHDSRDVKNLIGTISAIEETDAGLKIKGQLKLETNALAKEVYPLIKEGLITRLSIGFVPTKTKYEDGVRVVEQLDLYEVSLVPIGMNKEAEILDIKSADIDQQKHHNDVDRDFEMEELKEELERVKKELKELKLKQLRERIY